MVQPPVYTCFGQIHASNNGFRLAIHVHEGRVHLFVAPVQESLDHVQALLGVSSATERHGPQQGDRLFRLRGRHVATGHKLCQVNNNASDTVSLAEPYFSQPVHAKRRAVSRRWAKVVTEDHFRERREVTEPT